MEATGKYSTEIAQWFRAATRDVQSAIINPRLDKAFAESLSVNNRNDKVDARNPDLRKNLQSPSKDIHRWITRQKQTASNPKFHLTRNTLSRNRNQFSTAFGDSVVSALLLKNGLSSKSRMAPGIDGAITITITSTSTTGRNEARKNQTSF